MRIFKEKNVNSIFKAIVFKYIIKNESLGGLGLGNIEKYLPIFTHLCPPNSVG